MRTVKELSKGAPLKDVVVCVLSHSHLSAHFTISFICFPLVGYIFLFLYMLLHTEVALLKGDGN